MSGWVERGPWLRRWRRNSRGKATTLLKALSERQLNRWCRQLVRKGRRIESLGAARRHRLRLKAKRLRYMLEALTNAASLFNRNKLRHLHRAAKQLQQTLGDLRDLKRLAQLNVPANGRSRKKLPDYRRHRKKLRRSAAEALRSIKHAGSF